MAEPVIRPIRQPDRLVNYWLQEKFTVVCIVIFGLLFNISMILGPIYQGKLIDSLVAREKPTAVARLAVTFLILIAMIQILRYFKRFYIRRFANRTGATMRLMLYNSILQKDTTQLQQENTGELMSKAVSDVELCVEGMRKFTTEVFDTGVLMASYLVTMLVYDVKIALLSILFVPAAMLLAEKLKVLIYRYTAAYRNKNSEVTGFTYDLAENAMLYRVSGMDPANLEQYRKELDDLCGKAVKANILENSMQPVYNVIAMAGSLIVIGLGGRKVLEGGWTIGMFSTFMTIFIAMANKASKASKLFNSVQKSQVSWRRIKPSLTEYRLKSSACNLPSGPVRLSVNDLSFSYRPDSGPVISKLSFEGRQGEIIGITGPVASGKSGLGIALTGLYPYLGSIRVGGKELTEYSTYERSRMISYHGHHPELLSDTIYQNIVLGEQLDVTEVLKHVCFDTDLAAMPEGIMTPVGNGGVRLSGGQQARIALARALVRKSRLIILDDPLSAVDMNTEMEIIKNLKLHYRDSIILLISHRLAVFPMIDRIVLLHPNQTSEYGTHQELMNSSSLYSNIYKLQSEEGGGRNG